jgi:methylmalonyl-CoA/ethylmalonyl-CoA epimerase
MDTIKTKTSVELNFAQIGWVVKDIKAAERFFKETMGISNFSETFTSNAQDYDGTYYGEPSDAETLVSMGYSGDTFIELIQPVSGKSIFQDFLDKYPGGGIQHVAFKVSEDDFDKVISELTDKGYAVAGTYDTSIAKIVMFDTYEEIGVMTEIMGITKVGVEQIEAMKRGMK